MLKEKISTIEIGNKLVYTNNKAGVMLVSCGNLEIPLVELTAISSDIGITINGMIFQLSDGLCRPTVLFNSTSGVDRYVDLYICGDTLFINPEITVIPQLPEIKRDSNGVIEYIDSSVSANGVIYDLALDVEEKVFYYTCDKDGSIHPIGHVPFVETSID